VCGEVVSSSASRIAATRPSIMSDGATMSHPFGLRDRDPGEQLERRIVADAASSTRPQWPWLVY